MSEIRYGNETGKLIDKWAYHIPSQQHVHNKPKIVMVEIRMKQDKLQGNHSPLETHAVKFIVRCPEHQLELHGTDLDKIRAAMWLILDERYAPEYENFLKVTINERPFCEFTVETSEIKISVQEITKVVYGDGSEYQLHSDRGRRQQLTPWKYTTDQFRANVSIIPDNEENRAAIKAFQNGIETIHSQMTQMLKQDDIEANLHSILHRSDQMALRSEL